MNDNDNIKDKSLIKKKRIINHIIINLNEKDGLGNYLLFKSLYK